MTLKPWRQPKGFTPGIASIHSLYSQHMRHFENFKLMWTLQPTFSQNVHLIPSWWHSWQELVSLLELVHRLVWYSLVVISILSMPCLSDILHGGEVEYMRFSRKKPYHWLTDRYMALLSMSIDIPVFTRCSVVCSNRLFQMVELPLRVSDCIHVASVAYSLSVQFCCKCHTLTTLALLPSTCLRPTSTFLQICLTSTHGIDNLKYPVWTPSLDIFLHIWTYLRRVPHFKVLLYCDLHHFNPSYDVLRASIATLNKVVHVELAVVHLA